MSAKKHILLIEPYSKIERGLIPPYSLLALARMFKDTEFEVTVIDCHLTQDFWPLIEEKLDETVIVGVTSLSGLQPAEGARLCAELKKRKPSLKTCWGGFHASLYPEQTLRSPVVDFVINGQGEHPFYELVHILFAGAEGRLEDIPGLYFKRDGEVIKGQGAKSWDINTLPPYPLEMVDFESYVVKGGKTRAVQFITSKGCPFPCTFCCIPFTDTYKRFSPMDAMTVADAVEGMVRDYNVNYFKFYDDNYWGRPRRPLKIATEFIRRGLNIKYLAEARADSMSKLSDANMELLVESGMDAIMVGAETGSERLLKEIKKKISVDQIIQTAEICAKYGVTPMFSFITCFPGETPEDSRETGRLIRKLYKINPMTTIGLHAYNPYYTSPGALRDLKERDPNFFVPETLEDWGRLQEGQFLGEDFDMTVGERRVQLQGWYLSFMTKALSESLINRVHNPDYSSFRVPLYQGVYQVARALFSVDSPRLMIPVGYAARFINKYVRYYTKFSV